MCCGKQYILRKGEFFPPHTIVYCYPDDEDDPASPVTYHAPRPCPGSNKSWRTHGLVDERQINGMHKGMTPPGGVIIHEEFTLKLIEYIVHGTGTIPQALAYIEKAPAGRRIDILFAHVDAMMASDQNNTPAMVERAYEILRAGGMTLSDALYYRTWWMPPRVATGAYNQAEVPMPRTGRKQLNVVLSLAPTTHDDVQRIFKEMQDHCRTETIEGALVRLVAMGIESWDLHKKDD